MADSLGQYDLGERVVSGPVVDVYRATDTSLGRTVTVKVLRPAVANDAARRDAILAVAREVQPLSHPNIAELFDVGEQNGKHYLVFEYTPGDTLRGTIAGSPLNVRRAVDLGAQVADALAEAHGRGIVHGALRPDLVVVTAKGRPKILDFGLAKAPAIHKPRAEGASALSPDDVECMSPEQVLGAAGDHRSDVFAVGCLLFEMLTGTQPFSAATGADTAVAVLSRTPPPPSQLNARVPEELDRVVARCLAKSLGGRYENAAALAADLRHIAAALEIDDSAGVQAPSIVGLRHRQSKLPVAVIGAVCVLVLALVVYLVFAR